MGSCARSNAAGGRLSVSCLKIMKVEKKLVKTPLNKTKVVNTSDMKTGNVAQKDKSNSKDDKSSGSKKEINVGSASVHSPPRASRTGAKSKSVGTGKSTKVHGSKVVSKKVIVGKSKTGEGNGANNGKRNKDASVKNEANKSKKQDNKVKDGANIKNKRDGSITRGPPQASNSGLKQSQEESAKKTPTLSTKSSKLVTGTCEKKAGMAGESKDAKKIESEKKSSTRSVAKSPKKKGDFTTKKASINKSKKKQTPLKVSKKMFLSKPQKRALTNDDRRIQKRDEKNKSIDDSNSEKVCRE